MTCPTQLQLYQESERNLAEVNKLFLEMITGDDPLTKEELAANIKRRPELWGRFAGWLDKLSSKDS